MEVMTLAQIMDKSVDILKKYVKTIVLFRLGYGVIGFIALVVSIMIVSIAALADIAEKPNITAAVTIGVLYGILMIVVFAFIMAASAAVTRIVNQEYGGEEIKAHDAIGIAFSSLPKAAGIVLLTVLCYAPVMAIYAGLGYFFFKQFRTYQIFQGVMSMGGILSIIMIYLVVIIAALSLYALYTWFAFAIQVAVIEKKGIFGAIKRSFWLVGNSFWRLFGCLLLIFLTVYAVNTSLQSVVAVIAAIAFLIIKLLNFQTDYTLFITSIITYARWPLNLLSWLVISPVGAVMTTLLYFNQRFKKEGYDLLLRTEKLEKNAKGVQAIDAVD